MRNHIEQMKKYLFYIMATAALLGCSKQQDNKSDVFVCGGIKTDTMYHIASIDGDLIYYDSIRIEMRQFPDHYIHYTGWDTYNMIVCTDTLTNDEYRAMYCNPIYTYTYAQADTIMNIHAPGYYKNAGVWALRQILVTGYRPVTNR